ncbi:MAG: MFS transporter, partial [Clostridia bacterium]|nr:MFS transporter [Clostridia bacterium]
MKNNFKLTKLACYSAFIATASAFSLPPLLFVTFREMYGISYTLLGTLVLINFSTQLIIDLIFTFFTKYFNIPKIVKITPLITTLGFLIYAIVPSVSPSYAYLGLVLGTIIFSISAGLGEVLLSPVIAACPSDNPERDMSALHSLYGYGVVSVVILSTVYLRIFGTENWMYLAIFWALLPIVSFILFSISPMPEMKTSENAEKSEKNRKKFGLMLCVLCIFLGGATENTMTNWISSFMEKAVNIPKVTGDILGMAVFAALLALTRSLYAKYGKNILRMLFCGMVGASVCYLIIAFCPNPLISMLACILTGIFTSMLWPGTLILMEEKIPGVGV